MKRVLLVLLLGGVTAGCASAQAKAPADRPVMEVPPPPPRMIDPTPEAESPTPALVPDLPTTSPAPVTKPRPAPTRENKPPTEPKPPDNPPAEQPAPPTAPPPAPAPQLRTPGSASGPEAAKQVKDLIDKARRTLESVDWRRLNRAQQEAYNNAKLMLTNAEEQLKESNFDIARENADKASRIATELQGR
jgi:hypothetical protein